jgi:hypothetical protein
MSKRFSLGPVAILALAVAACGGGVGDPEPSIAPGEGAGSPVGAVEELVSAINSADFAEASRLAVPGQAALAALAEGAGLEEVADALAEGDEEVAANFWAGFAQGTGSFLTGPVTAVDDGVVTQGDVEFHRITVEPPSGATRSVLVKEVDGYRVDLFASFGPALADKMMAPAERLLTTRTADARLILARLQDIVPSLLVAAELAGTPGDVSQQILALIEVITRVG